MRIKVMITSRHIGPTPFWGLTKQVGPWKTTTVDLNHEALGYDSPHNQVQIVRPYQQNGSAAPTYQTRAIVSPSNVRGFRERGVGRFREQQPLGQGVQIFNQTFVGGPDGKDDGKDEAVEEALVPIKTEIVSEKDQIAKEKFMDSQRASIANIRAQREADIKEARLTNLLRKQNEAQTTLEAIAALSAANNGVMVTRESLHLQQQAQLARDNTQRQIDLLRAIEPARPEDLSLVPQHNQIVQPPPVVDLPDRAVEVFEPQTSIVQRKNSLSVEEIREGLEPTDEPSRQARFAEEGFAELGPSSSKGVTKKSKASKFDVNLQKFLANQVLESRIVANSSLSLVLSSKALERVKATNIDSTASFRDVNVPVFRSTNGTGRITGPTAGRRRAITGPPARDRAEAISMGTLTTVRKSKVSKEKEIFEQSPKRFIRKRRSSK